MGRNYAALKDRDKGDSMAFLKDGKKCLGEWVLGNLIRHVYYVGGDGKKGPDLFDVMDEETGRVSFCLSVKKLSKIVERSEDIKAAIDEFNDSAVERQRAEEDAKAQAELSALEAQMAALKAKLTRTVVPTNPPTV